MNKIIICTYEDALIPEKQTDWSVCWDLKLAEDIEIEPRGLYIAKMWIKTYIPNGWHSRLYARWWLPSKRWLMLANWVWIVDSDYRWEYMFQLYNFTDKKVACKKYSRVWQIEFLPHVFDDKFNVVVPKIQISSDQVSYDNFEKDYSTERWDWRFHSTWHI